MNYKNKQFSINTRITAILLCLLTLTLDAPALAAKSSYLSESGMRKEMVRAIEAGEEELVITVRDGCDFNKVFQEVTQQYIASGSIDSNSYVGDRAELWIELDIGSGRRIMGAIARNSLGSLTASDRQVYERATRVLERLLKPGMTELDIEFAIHDELARLVTYKLEGDVSDARAALINGEASCSGYTDAFYLLGRLGGLTIEKVSGVGDGGPHAWNVVKLGGRWYSVDVTWDDQEEMGIIHRYLNAPVQIMRQKHTLDGVYDGLFSFGGMDEYNYFVATGRYAKTASIFRKLAVQAILEDERFELMCAEDFDVEQMSNEIMRIALKDSGHKSIEATRSTEQAGGHRWLLMHVEFS